MSESLHRHISPLVFLSASLSVGLCLFVADGCAIQSFDNGIGFGRATDADVTREIEETDIVKIQDGFFYLANPYTGLRIIDARDIDRPQMKGRLPLGGRSVEMFLQDGVAMVFTAADFLDCAGEPVGFDQAVFDPQVLPDYEGSRLWVVDVSDADQPAVVTTLDFDGFVTATRRVGDAIYVTGTAFFPIDATEDAGGSNSARRRGAFVTSINIADPAAAFIVQTELFPGVSLDIHVDDNAMYVFGRDSEVFDTTVVSYVDITDPQGQIRVRDQFRVPGSARDRFFVDAHDGAFRIITEERIRSVGANVVALYVFDVTNPDEITRAARLPIGIDNSLRTVRFDGDRAYAELSAFDESPLAVLDLSDPANPIIAGSLDTPGFGTKLFPMGDRLVAVGFDTTGGVRPTVILYDVADPAAPDTLARVVVGEQFTFTNTSTAAVDEKSIRILEDAGLILMPFGEFDRTTGLFADSVLLIELQSTGLSERGALAHIGFVRRADVLDQRLWILSDRSFQTADIDNLDAPVSRAVLEIIAEQDLLDAGLSGCANAARNDATTVFGSIPSPCGILGFVPLFAMFTGLSILKLRLK